MSLQRRLGAVLILGGLLASVGFTVCGLTFARLVDDQRTLFERYFFAVAEANEFQLAQVDQETGLRGYELSGERIFLRPYAEGVAMEAESVARLRTLLADEPKLLVGLDQSVAAAETWRRNYAAPHIALVESEGRAQITAAELSRGRELFNNLRASNRAFGQELLNERTDARDSLRDATTLLTAALVVAGIVTFIAGVALWWALRRWVTQPLNQLGAEVRQVQDGSLDHPIAQSGPREIAVLAGDVEAMRRQIVTEYASALAARAEVEAASRLVEEQAVELRRSNRDLEQFAYVASHDLQEPLRKVSSFCQMLERRYKGQLDERADQYISFAVDGAKRMQVLINDLLAFSRVGRSSAAFVDVDLEVCLSHAKRVLEDQIAQSGATITSDPLPTVQGETSLLTQLFQNLIGNAVKFRAEAAPAIHIGVTRTGDDTSAGGASGDGETWSFWVSDNGIGIEPQYADKIFVIFQRLHAKEEYGGTGIGLALCKKIVEYHGGRLWLDTDSRAGAAANGDAPQATGTTFRWTLPVAVSSPTPDEAVLSETGASR